MDKGHKILISLLFVMLSISLSAQNFSADRKLWNAYMLEDMSVWKHFVDSASACDGLTPDLMSYEYGYCGFLVDRDKEAANSYVERFRKRVEDYRQVLPPGHYEMWMSAVYVFELRLHESMHPVKAMSLAKEAIKLAPEDPLVLSYYGTSLFYAPKPFGSKQEALEWFEKAEKYFQAPEWEYCWVKEATEMYIEQCREKIGKH
jgi:tetratricopeptide (TPR) repeat protein